MIRKNCNTKWSPKTKLYSKDAETCSTLSHHPLYTNVPLNATYGRPFHEVASRIFVGTHKPPRSRQWPPTSPSLPPNRSSFSFHPPPFGGAEGKDRRVARGDQPPGGALLIPAARFRSQFSRALTRLPLTTSPFDPLSSTTLLFVVVLPLPYHVSLSFSLSLFLTIALLSPRSNTVDHGEKKLRKYSWPLTDRRIQEYGVGIAEGGFL